MNYGVNYAEYTHESVKVIGMYTYSQNPVNAMLTSQADAGIQITDSTDSDKDLQNS